jgi:hypothetical protein
MQNKASPVNKRGTSTWILTYQYLAGLSDTSTGILLLFAPAWTLTLMGVHRLPQPIEYASFVGVFVLGVGLAYLSITRLALHAVNTPRWQTVWVLTALIRMLVAAFLLAEILAGRMEPAWSTVALWDGALSVIQWVGLGRGWLNFES